MTYTIIYYYILYTLSYTILSFSFFLLFLPSSVLFFRSILILFPISSSQPIFYPLPHSLPIFPSSPSDLSSLLPNILIYPSPLFSSSSHSSFPTLVHPDLSVNSKYTCRVFLMFIYIPIQYPHPSFPEFDPACFIGVDG